MTMRFFCKPLSSSFIKKHHHHTEQVYITGIGRFSNGQTTCKSILYSTVYAMNFIEVNWPVQKFCLIQDFCTVDHWQI